MPDYSEAVERVADWLDEFATAVEANPNLLENHDRYDDAQAVLIAAGANEHEQLREENEGREMKEGEAVERGPTEVTISVGGVETVRFLVPLGMPWTSHERPLTPAGANELQLKTKAVDDAIIADLAAENARLKADYEELVIQAAKERGILNAEQTENERLTEEVEKYKRWNIAVAKTVDDDVLTENERLREALKKLASLGPTQAATVVSAIANEALAPTNRKDAE